MVRDNVDGDVMSDIPANAAVVVTIVSLSLPVRLCNAPIASHFKTEWNKRLTSINHLNEPPAQHVHIYVVVVTR